MSDVSRNCRNRVQRLRDGGDDTPLSSGSRGSAPGELCHLLPSCCSNPRRVFVSPVHGLAGLPVRLCECEPWVVSAVKSGRASNHSEIPAKIAAFQGWASGRIHYLFHTTACWPGVRTGAHPPLFPRPP